MIEKCGDDLRVELRLPFYPETVLSEKIYVQPLTPKVHVKTKYRQLCTYVHRKYIRVFETLGLSAQISTVQNKFILQLLMHVQ